MVTLTGNMRTSFPFLSSATDKNTGFIKTIDLRSTSIEKKLIYANVFKNSWKDSLMKSEHDFAYMQISFTAFKTMLRNCSSKEIQGRNDTDGYSIHFHTIRTLRLEQT